MPCATTLPTVGDPVVCAETGQPFTVARDGCSYNYALTGTREVLSDAGVDIRQKRALLERAAPVALYVSTDGRHVTGWKGNRLGVVVRSSRIRNPFGGYQLAVTVRDVHGGMWHGRGAGEGMCITLRPSRTA